MNNAKYFRVVKRISNEGKVEFKVQSVASLYDMIFGLWDNYKLCNDSLDEAISQIETINKSSIKSKKIVYKLKAK